MLWEMIPSSPSPSTSTRNHWVVCGPIERFGQHLLNDKHRGSFWESLRYIGPGPFPVFGFFVGPANGPKRFMNEDTFTQTFLPKTQGFDQKKETSFCLDSSLSPSYVMVGWTKKNKRQSHQPTLRVSKTFTTVVQNNGAPPHHAISCPNSS